MCDLSLIGTKKVGLKTMAFLTIKYDQKSRFAGDKVSSADYYQFDANLLLKSWLSIIYDFSAKIIADLDV